MQSLTIKKSLLAEIFAHEPTFIARLNDWPDQVPLTIDSRFVPERSIFFAIKGDLSDGHDFIDEALEKGAILVVAASMHAARFKDKNRPILLVDDTLRCFSLIAHRHLQSMPAKRIALSGSNGKTTVKEMIKAALGAVLGADAVYASRGTFNNHFGVPISALEVRPQHKIAIFEIGMNHAGEIEELCKIIKPELGLITNIGIAHAGNFSDGIAGVQRAKGELFAALGTKGQAVINVDDERVKSEASKYHFLSQSTFAKHENADLRLLERKPYSLENASQEIVMSFEAKTISFTIPLPGAHNAENAIAALAVVKELGLSVEEAATGFSQMAMTAGRLNVVHAQDCLIINDAYNANPLSMKAGIAACLELESKRRIAVIGAMGELGASSERYHFELGQLLAEHFQAIFACGHSVKPLLLGAESHGMAKSNLVYKNSSEELISPVQNYIKPGDLVFIKGSKSARMQVVAHALAAKQ